MTPREFRKRQLEKLEQRKIQTHQKISNDFIDNTISKNNLVCLKVMFYLSTVLEKEDLSTFDDENIICVFVDTKQMLEYIGSNVKDIRNNLKQMQETSISFVDEKENIVEGMNLLPLFKIEYGKNRTEIHLFKRIANMIVGVSKNYTFLNTKLLMDIKNKNTLRMAPLLYEINGYDKHIGKRKRMDLDALNDFFGTTYKRIIDIEKNILQPVKKELDLVSKLSFTYQVNFDTLNKVGRPRALSVTIDLKDNQGNLFAN